MLLAATGYSEDMLGTRSICPDSTVLHSTSPSLSLILHEDIHTVSMDSDVSSHRRLRSL